MHRSEAAELVHCWDCGAEISLALDRTFALDEDAGICFACAIRRGGVYEEAHDTWTRAPDISELHERERA